MATLARHYAGVLDALEDQERVPAAEAIWQARERLQPTKDAFEPAEADRA